MARFEFRLPDIGEGVTEGEIVAWHVKEGDRVAEDQLMVEVMTDKATVTIGAPRGGRIDKLYADVGHVVKVGDVLVAIATGNGSRIAAQLPAATAVGDIKDALPGTGFFGEKRATVSAAPSASTAAYSVPASARAPTFEIAPPKPAPREASRAYFAEKPLATPATRKLARDLSLDLRTIAPTGPHGRVTREDVLGHTTSSGQQLSPLAAPNVVSLHDRTSSRVSEASPEEGWAPDGSAGGAGRARALPGHQSKPGDRIPFVGLRRRIAEKMALSKSTAAHFTFVEECEADRLVALRDELKQPAAERGIELTYMPFLIKAVIEGLLRHPVVNSSLDVEKNEIVLHDRYHIGIAAATDQGLLVPVIHDADKLTLLELAAEVQRLSHAARENKLTRDELSGSTFTVTSLGKQAGLLAVPILNYPNVGILGVHRIKERPVVRKGQIVIGQVMLLSLSLDHRIVDGHIGAAFAYEVIAALEAPSRLLL